MCLPKSVRINCGKTALVLTRSETSPTSTAVVNNKPVKEFIYLSYEVRETHEEIHFLIVLFLDKTHIISNHSTLTSAYAQCVTYLCS
jgi:hypothetical protein